MFNRLQTAMEMPAEEQDAVALDPEAQSALMESTINQDPYHDVLANAALAVEQMVLTLEASLDDGGASPELQRMVQVGQHNVHTLLDDPSVTELSIESEATAYQQTLLAIESLMESFKAILQKIVDFIKTIWRRFTDWVGDLFDRSQATKRRLEKLIKRCDVLLDDGFNKVSPPEGRLMGRDVLLVYLDEVPETSVVDFIVRFARDLKTHTKSNIKEGMEAVRQMSELFQGSYGSGKKPKLSLLGKVSMSDWNRIPKPEVRFGYPLYRYHSGLLPGGWRIEFNRLELTDAQQRAVEQDPDPTEAIKLMWRSEFKLFPESVHPKEVRFRQLKPSQIRQTCEKMIKALEVFQTAQSDLRGFLSEGNRLISKVEPLPAKLQALSLGSKEGRYYHEAFNAVRRLLRSFTSSPSTQLTYLAHLCNSYTTLLEVNMKFCEKTANA